MIYPSIDGYFDIFHWIMVIIPPQLSWPPTDDVHFGPVCRIGWFPQRLWNPYEIHMKSINPYETHGND